MKIWFTASGNTTMKTIAKVCRNKQYRLVVVAGCNQVIPLLDYLKQSCNKELRIQELNSIDELAETSITEGNQLIILHSLVSRFVEKPIDYLNRYCRQRQYQLMYAPFSMRKSDFENLYQYELDAGLERSCSGNRWALDIAHETALLLSMGILNCYYSIRDIFVTAYRNNTDQLPDAKQCVIDYSMKQDLNNESVYIKERLRRMGGIELLIRNQDDDDWLILWSIGLAGKYNGSWYLSPYLLDSPKMYRELQHRMQWAVNNTLIPIYQAWVFYCEKKYNLRELDDEKQLIPWYPKSVLRALEYSGLADQSELELCREVKGLRNWVQHDEGENQDCYLRDYRQTRIRVMCTCAKVIKKIDPNGNLR